jgi:hypothetical protein
MDKKLLWPVILAGLVGLVIIFYPRPAPEPPRQPLDLPEPAAATRPDTSPLFAPETDPEPAPEFLAVEPTEPPPPLPALDESDADARAALARAAGETLVDQHLVPDDVIRKLVATVDNLPREALWIKSRAVPPVDGRLVVAGPEGARVLSPENFLRYAPLVQLVGAVDARALASAYRQHYPLLQQAYEELGYPGRQFHNRALEVIDHLLATPVVEGPIRLEQPHVLYTFADPRLEALSPGQKIMLRVGPENAAVLRAKLIELRAALEERPATPDAD